MPSSLHEVLLQLFRDRPAIAVDFIAARLDSRWSDARRVELLDGDLAQLSAPQHRADTVLLLTCPGPDDRLAVVLEVQLAVDPDKCFAWPVYLAGIRARLRCPAVLLVVAPDPGVRNWARRPISIGPSGDTMRPLVLGPDAVPVVTDVGAARKNIELAVLSALVHARGRKAIAAAVAAVAAVGGLAEEGRIDEERLKLSTDLIHAALGTKARRLLEALMREGYEYQSEFARKYVAEGKAAGIAEGTAEGRIAGKLEGLLTILAARKLPLSAAQRETVTACRDPGQFDRWIARAATADASDGIFA